MKLLFRPDKFTDSKGQEIELEDIEIEDVNIEGCSECSCGYGWINITFNRKVDPPMVFSTITTENLDSIWDLQDEIEKTWNASLPDEPFKRKNSLGRLDENSGVKLQLDLEGLKGINKGLKIANEIIEEQDMTAPISLTYEDIIKAIERKKEDE
jgi:hypothetical protein